MAKTLLRKGYGAWGNFQAQAAQASAPTVAATPMDAPTTPGYQAGVTGQLSQYLQQHPDKAALAYGPQLTALLDPTKTTANAGYGNTVYDSFGNETATGLDLGATLGQNADPNAVTPGSFDWNNVEASNPFSKAALLVRNYQQQQAKSSTDFASQGLFGSGAAQRQQQLNEFGFQQGQDSLQKALQDYLVGQSQTRRNAGVTRNGTINQASLDALSGLLGS